MVKENLSSIRAVTLGVIVGYVIAIITFLIYGIILGTTGVSEITIPTAVKVVSAVTIFISGLMSAHWIHKKGWLYGALAGLIYIIILYILSLILRGPQAGSNMLINVVIAVLIGALGGIVGINI